MSDSNRTTQLIKDSVKKLYDAQKQKKQFDEFYRQVKAKEQVAISNYIYTQLPDGTNKFDITLDDGVEYYTNHVRLSVSRVRTKKIIWHLDKIKQKLDKEVCKDVISKTYTVNNMQGLTKYLKECGVDPKKFKKFIDVEEELDETMLNNYYDTGVIKKADVEGCYTLEVGEPYIRLTEQSR